MANTNHSINSQYKLISNLISTKSDRDFNILINNVAGNIKNLISSESKKVGFSVDIDDVYSKTLSILWKKLPYFNLPSNKLEGINSLFSYIKSTVFNCIRSQRDKYIKASKRNLYIDGFEDNSFEIKDEQDDFFDYEEEIAFWRDQLQDKQKEDFDIMIDFAYNKYSLEDICKKYKISNPKHIYLKNNKVRECLRSKKAA